MPILLFYQNISKTTATYKNHSSFDRKPFKFKKINKLFILTRTYILLYNNTERFAVHKTLTLKEVNFMKKASRIIWGIALVAVGIIIALDVFGVLEASEYIFFKGWWTLFIIIPFTVSVFSEGPRVGNLIGLTVGVLLLLGSRDVIETDIILKLCVPALIVIIGLCMIFGLGPRKGSGKINKKINEIKNNADGSDEKSFAAVFSGQDINLSGEKMQNITLDAVFGGINCDLRGALFEKDVVISANAVFGGIDIIVPDGINVKVKSTSIFGGVSNKHRSEELPLSPTVYVNGTGIFGGVDVK